MRGGTSGIPEGVIVPRTPPLHVAPDGLATCREQCLPTRIRHVELGRSKALRGKVNDQVIEGFLHHLITGLYHRRHETLKTSGHPLLSEIRALYA